MRIERNMQRLCIHLWEILDVGDGEDVGFQKHKFWKARNLAEEEH